MESEYTHTYDVAARRLAVGPSQRSSLAVPLVATAAACVLAVLSAVTGVEVQTASIGRLRDELWLAVATLLSACLFALIPNVSHAVVSGITRRTPHASQVVEIVPALVVLTYAVLIEIMLRRPLVLVLGMVFASSQVDAAFGWLALALLLVLLSWIYFQSQPIVVKLVRQLLDAVIPTIELRTAVVAAERPTYFQPPQLAERDESESGIEDPLIGRNFRDHEYLIQDALGTGGEATVYGALSASLERRVAVKVLRPGLAAAVEGAERLHDEARKMAQLHHPNLVEAYYFGKEDEHVYLAMRLVRGGSLRDRLERDGPFGLVEAARLTSQVAAALQHAHDAGFVHLDVKSGNVLLGSAEWPLLGDLGIAQVIGGANPADRPGVAGTRGYMSPEQSRGIKVDGRSDQYSLAVTCYELVTGSLPDPAILAAALRGERALNPILPAPVEKVLLKALAPEPGDRYPSIQGFANALVREAERTRGLTQETKDNIAETSPNLLASLLLILLGPLLLAMLPTGASIRPGLPLTWPFQLILAGGVVGLLLGIRFQVLGLLQRGIQAFSDVLDRRTRMYAASRGQLLQTSPSGWQSQVAACIGGLINLGYVFGIYRLVAVPFVAVVSALVDAQFARLIALALAGVAVLAAFIVVVAIYRLGGLAPAAVVLGAGWALVGVLPTGDVSLGLPGLAWITRVAVGAGVIGVLLVRRRQTAERVAWLAAAVIGRIGPDRDPAIE